MATPSAELKTVITSDASGFNKGVQQAKRELKDLQKTGTDALGAIGAAFGVDTRQLTQFSNALSGLGQKLQQTGNEGAAAFGKILKSVGPAATAIAGLGIAGAVTAFKALKAEAEAFGNTIDGLNLKMATEAYIKTYRQVLHDANSETGQSVGEALSNWQKGWERFKSNVGATFVQWVAGKDTVGLAQAWQKVSAAATDAEAAAARNEARGNRLADIMKEELTVRKEVADIDLKIAEQRRILRDRSADSATRSRAEAELRQLIADKTAKQTTIAQELYEIHEAMSKEAGSSYEDMQKVVSLYESWKSKIASASDQLAQVDRYSNSIKTSTDDTAENIERIKKLREGEWGKAINAAPLQFPSMEDANKRAKDLADEISNVGQNINENEAERAALMDAIQRKQEDIVTGIGDSVENTDALAAAEARINQLLDEQIQLISRRSALKIKQRQLDYTITNNDLIQGKAVSVPTHLLVPPQQEFDTFKELCEFQLGGISFTVGMELDAEKWQNIADQIAQGLNSAISNTVSSLSQAVGTLMGDLITGKDGWNDFANSAVQAFGDMAIAVGKIAIEAGTTVIGLKAAMESMSVPAAYIAIAAGAALVAIGSAVKAGMSNIAAGNYSAGGGLATSSASSALESGYEQRDVYVNVTGTLVADGDQLLAVINNTDKKNYFTT